MRACGGGGGGGEGIEACPLANAVYKLRGGSRIFGKGVHMDIGVWNRFADFISFFLKYTMKMK